MLLLACAMIATPLVRIEPVAVIGTPGDAEWIGRDAPSQALAIGLTTVLPVHIAYDDAALDRLEPQSPAAMPSGSAMAPAGPAAAPPSGPVSPVVGGSSDISVPPVDAANPAATPAMTAAAASDISDAGVIRDPWEHSNRSIFAFDLALDRIFLRPVAHSYQVVVPSFIRARITNILANLNEPITAVNDLLQLHPKKFEQAVVRIILNTTFGLGGMFDIAGHHGLARHNSDFGQTLGRYGVHPGRFIVLPGIGPSNFRDALGLLVDTIEDPVSFLIGGITATAGATRGGLQILDDRVAIDPFIKATLEATDPYATARSAYLQHRAAVVQEATGKAQALPDFDAPK